MVDEVKWIKIATRVFDNRKIRQIEIMPEGDSMLVIWFKLLCLAGNTNDKGQVYFTEEIPYTEQMLAAQFSRPLATVQMALGLFQKFGMIEVIDNIIHVSSWEKYQNIEGMEKIKAQTRKRVAEHRERKRLGAQEEGSENGEKQSNVTCNVTVTPSNATDKEEEEEKEREEEREYIKKKKEKKKSEFDLIIEHHSLDIKLRETIYNFVEMRKTIKAPMTANALKLMLNKLSKLSADNDECIAILEQSIMNSWKGIFELKDQVKKNTNNSNFMKNMQELYEEVKEDGETGACANNNSAW